jgi:catechol-2,3-dioxygenase
MAHKETTVGHIHLTVSDLERALDGDNEDEDD